MRRRRSDSGALDFEVILQLVDLFLELDELPGRIRGERRLLFGLRLCGKSQRGGEG